MLSPFANNSEQQFHRSIFLGQSVIIDEGGFRTSEFPPDYPSCDYTGKVQTRLDDDCECLQYR